MKIQSAIFFHPFDHNLIHHKSLLMLREKKKMEIHFLGIFLGDGLGALFDFPNPLNTSIATVTWSYFTSSFHPSKRIHANL